MSCNFSRFYLTNSVNVLNGTAINNYIPTNVTPIFEEIWATIKRNSDSNSCSNGSFTPFYRSYC